MDLCVISILMLGYLMLSYRRVDRILFIYLGVCFLLTLFIPETLAPVLLRRKAEALRKQTGDDSYVTVQQLEKVPFSETLKVALVRPLMMLLQEPIVIFMTCCVLYSIFFLCYH